MTAVTDVEVPLALEPRLYLDPELIEVEQERIFERTWQLIGHASALPQPGSYTTGFAGSQPVLVVRDEANGLRAYRNVCRHRCGDRRGARSDRAIGSARQPAALGQLPARRRLAVRSAGERR